MSRALRLGLFTAVGLLLAAAATRVWLRSHPPLREAFTLYGVGLDTSVLFVRLSVSDAGFINGQLTTRAAYVEQGGQTVEHRAQYGVATVAPEGITGGPDQLVQDARGWNLRVGGTGVQLTGQLRGAEPGCPPRAGALTGGLGLTPQDAVSPSGAITSSGGTVLHASALVTHTRAPDAAPGPAFYVFSPSFSAGVDPDSDCPAWVRDGEHTWTGAAPSTLGPGPLVLDRWTLQLKAAGPPVLLDGNAHLHPLERVMAGLVGFHPAVQSVRRVSVRVDGPGATGPRTGILVGSAD